MKINYNNLTKKVERVEYSSIFFHAEQDRIVEYYVDYKSRMNGNFKVISISKSSLYGYDNLINGRLEVCGTYKNNEIISNIYFIGTKDKKICFSYNQKDSWDGEVTIKDIDRSNPPLHYTMEILN